MTNYQNKDKNMFELIHNDIRQISIALVKFDKIIIESRAMGNYKRGSDIDIAVIGNGITSETLYKLSDLSTRNLLYRIMLTFFIMNPSDKEVKISL